MYRPVLVTAPEIAPVSRTEAKSHCRVDHDEDDAIIDGLISAAVSHLDGWTGILGRCLVEQEWRQDFDDFWGCLRLPLFPVNSISSVKYLDAAGAEQALDPQRYSLQTDDLGSFVRFTTGFSAPAVYEENPTVSVTYKAGYPVTGSDPNKDASVPQAIKQAILLMVGHWYNNREAAVIGADVKTLPFAVDALLTPFRRVRF